MHPSAQKLDDRKILSTLLLIVVGSWLVYIPADLAASKTLRWALLMSVMAFIVSFSITRRVFIDNFRSFTLMSKVVVTLIALFMIVSFFFSEQSITVRLLGWQFECLGLLSWLSFLVLGITLKDAFKDLLSSRAFLVFCALLLIFSLLADMRLLLHGVRLSGVFMVATSMGVFSALAVMSALWHMGFRGSNRKSYILPGLVFTLGLVSVLLSQSRAAQFAALLGCVVFAAYFVYLRQKSVFVAVAGVGMLLFVPVLGGSYFERLQSEQVAGGISYRWDIYSIASKEVITERPLVGVGPSGIPESINSRQQAPEGILETLNMGYVFLSAHDIILDIFLSFGVFAGVGFMVLLIQSFLGLVSTVLTPDHLLAGLAFITLLINGLLNVPSIEMTSFLFIAVFALLPVRHERTPQSKVD